MSLERGTVVLLSLDPAQGHEQRGARPCVIVTAPEVSMDQRYPMLAVVPITGTPGEGALYPPLRPGPSGLTKPSWALVDQVRSVEKHRVFRAFGTVAPVQRLRLQKERRIVSTRNHSRRPLPPGGTGREPGCCGAVTCTRIIVIDAQE